MSRKLQTPPAPEIPWRPRLFFSLMSLILKISLRSNGTINRFFFRLFDIKVPPSSKPTKGVTTSDVFLPDHRSLWFRIYNPVLVTVGRHDVSLPVIVYFHGGGYVFMAADSKLFDHFCRRLALELPAVVISVNYRLAPENSYPSQCDDGIDVMKFIDDDPKKNIEGFPAYADLDRCFLAGDSAGGNLVHQVVVNVKAREHRFSNVTIRGVFAIQPFFGGEERTESEIRLDGIDPVVNIKVTDWMWRAVLPVGSNRDHPTANVFGANEVEVRGLEFPATMVFVGGFDPLQDRQRSYYERLKVEGKETYLVEYPNAIHGFYLFHELPESSLMINEFRDFIRTKSLPPTQK